MKFDIVTDYQDVLDSSVVTLEEAQFIFPGSSRDLSHLVPGMRIRLGRYTVGYCLVDTETKSFYEL